MPTLQNFPGFGSGVSFIDCYIEQAVDVILSVGRTLSSEGANRGSIQIISPTRAGKAGINAINHHFHQLRAPGRDHFPGRNIAEGDPVIWLTNDYERDLQNGSTGRFLGLDKECRPKVELDGRMFTMKSNDGANLDLAYSISVHKSQGSQWPRVIVPVFPSRILDRTLAYTAITRASEQVVLLGDRSAFQRAIEATAAVDRRKTCLGARFDNLIGDVGVDLSRPFTTCSSA
jgi:exodeoxyribonuclease V alpha subunit